MSMKRILGTMLASRMAGRGGSRGALGTAAALGMLGSFGRRGRGGMGSKMGLAALGYMAYQAYQGSQSKQQAPSGTQNSGSRQAGDGLMDKLRNAANDLLGGQAAGTDSNDQNVMDQSLQDGEAAADQFGEDKALLMIRAMISAAYADGAMSDDERRRILQAINAADATSDERHTMEREIANPKPLDTLLASVTRQHTH